MRPLPSFLPRLRALARDEAGAVTIPAVIFLPFLLMILFSSVEMAVLNVRQVLLDKGLDQTVRILRLGISPLPANDAEALRTLKRSICTNIGFIGECMSDISVEIFEVKRDVTVTSTGSGAVSVTRDWRSTVAATTITCTDRNLAPTPAVTLNRAAPGQLMLVRACLKVQPMMPGFGLGALLHKDSAGRVALVSHSAYVREPFVAPGSAS